MTNKNKLYILISIVIASVLTAGWFFFGKKVDEVEAPVEEVKSLLVSNIPEAESVEQPKENLIRRNIDGVYVAEGEDNHYPVAVMIDNHKDARPASGIAKANLVIEAEAEGGVTRYFVVFASGEKIDEIGPIRSARPYFVDWAEGLSALYVHVGGSPDALTKIINDGVYDMNEFYKGKYFWRDTTRKKPHNVYISSNSLNEYLETKKLSVGDFTPWQFKDDELKENRPATSSTIKINYRIKDFIVEWKYDPENNNYVRSLGGEIYKDKDGTVVTAKNVAVQYTRADVVDDKSRLDMTVVGTGKALVCQDGKCDSGTWKKPTKKDRTRFFVNDNEVAFNAGLTWVNVVRTYYKVEQILN
ncbi:DUF3048 domain-containing protein [Candidatus Parcubacteria bacterium]|nr:DUF3048 domain-containing protein [Patescibacteria group bacterium]MBU4308929.1 DUF3048 domain-containing protein [Patescibacteria group bacterium]MBU4431819.1 DUF3048 domain-containing protein [Patescibacteria group bacterium]MBU4577289.1 DUF3048 domain-containing protein [Patescibacteria group bacterium]MCG2696979.1 DUF3048 domain-containing protein [Candidatus Parcubacteria bacterium]